MQGKQGRQSRARQAGQEGQAGKLAGRADRKAGRAGRAGQHFPTKCFPPKSDWSGEYPRVLWIWAEKEQYPFGGSTVRSPKGYTTGVRSKRSTTNV